MAQHYAQIAVPLQVMDLANSEGKKVSSQECRRPLKNSDLPRGSTSRTISGAAGSGTPTDVGR
jgi:hypothetical protein